MDVTDKQQSNADKMTFDDFDKLDLKTFAENLFQIMEKGVASSIGEQGAYTISLNAEFGNGKTTFLKMFEDFIKEKKQNYNVLFIDAWESDFYGEPVIAILSEFTNYIRKNGNKQNKEIKEETIKKALKVIGSITNQVIQSKTGLNVKEIINFYKDRENNLSKEEIVGKEILKRLHSKKKKLLKMLGK